MHARSVVVYIALVQNFEVILRILGGRRVGLGWLRSFCCRYVV
jgi:hypothetical protein